MNDYTVTSQLVCPFSLPLVFVKRTSQYKRWGRDLALPQVLSKHSTHSYRKTQAQFFVLQEDGRRGLLASCQEITHEARMGVIDLAFLDKKNRTCIAVSPVIPDGSGGRIRTCDLIGDGPNRPRLSTKTIDKVKSGCQFKFPKCHLPNRLRGPCRGGVLPINESSCSERIR